MKRQFAQILRHILGNEIHIEASVPPRNVPDSFVKKAEGDFGIFNVYTKVVYTLFSVTVHGVRGSKVVTLNSEPVNAYIVSIKHPVTYCKVFCHC